MSRRIVEVHIDRLVVHGGSEMPPGALTQSLQVELERLVLDHGLSSGLTDGAAVRNVRVSSASVAVPAVGGAVAEAVYGAIGVPREATP